MAKTKEIKKVSFATDPIGKLIVRFAIPCVIALVVNALYNIVDQIFIGWGVGYLGNGATNIVFPITIVALAFAVLVGDGGAAYLSLKLGEGDSESVKKGLGNAIVMVTALGVLILIIFLALMNPILALFGATDALLPYAQDYGYIIAIGLPFTMISTALNAMIRVDGSPKYAMLSMLLGAVIKADCLKVFIHADTEFRLRRIVEVYGEREASPEQRLKDKDKRRAAFHRFYTNMKWGHAENYDITLNSGTLGIEKCVEIIKELY